MRRVKGRTIITMALPDPSDRIELRGLRPLTQSPRRRGRTMSRNRAIPVCVGWARNGNPAASRIDAIAGSHEVIG